MRAFIICFLIALMGSSFIPSRSPEDSILGDWLNQEKDGKINLYKNGDKYFGKITWIRDAGKKDEKNPDPALRTKDIVGLVILKSLVYKDGVWDGGSIYDPKSGKTYDCTMKLKDGGKTLDIRGYVGISMFGRTSTWTRP
jgi:uncharacterized protein (DUF2147 family)